MCGCSMQENYITQRPVAIKNLKKNWFPEDFTFDCRLMSIWQIWKVCDIVKWI